MKNQNLMSLFCAALFVVFSMGLRAQCPIIPKPSKATKGQGFFQLNDQTKVIISSDQLHDVAAYFRTQLLEHKLLALPLGQEKNTPEKAIYLDLITDASLGDEAYKLVVGAKGIHISAASVSGVFYGTMSLLQLILEGEKENGSLQVAAWDVEDSPHYKWRGLMFDVSRYYVSEQKIVATLDWMAFYKLNVFHWHLTDSPGWRLEIKKYPKLALVGGVGDQFDPNTPTQYYTQEQVNRIVDYATKLNIKVIPEIDMPGHATGANRAYPEFSGGGSEKHPEFTFNPAKEETYGYLTEILKETNVMFPSNMLHLGGDEVSFGNEKWGTDPFITNFTKANNIDGLKGLEHYFMERMADSVYKMNSKLLVWDELAESSLPKDKTIIFWWRHDKPEQLTKSLENGFETVICPRIPYYLDFVQNEKHTSGRKWGGAFAPIEAVYNFDINTFADANKYEKQILGVQGNLWTETVDCDARLDYLLFPRIAALSESSWSTERTDYKGFEKRLESHLEYYKQAGLYYYNPINADEMSEPVQVKGKK